MADDLIRLGDSASDSGSSSRLAAIKKINIGEYPEPVLIENLETVASYNFIASDEPTIVVPGRPARWTPQFVSNGGKPLEPDSGAFFIDQNAARSPRHPLLPCLLALRTEKPDFDMSSLSLFSCRNTLRRILNFLSGNDANFAFYAHVWNDTVFFVRREDKGAVQTVDGNVFAGFGHGFLERNTLFERGFGDSTSHHRVLTYDCAGLKIGLRFECNGYFPVPGTWQREARRYTKASNQSSDQKGRKTNNVHEHSVKVAQNQKAIRVLARPNHQEPPDHSRIFDLKTRFVLCYKTLSSRYAPARAWLSQTPNVIWAVWWDPQDPPNRNQLRGNQNLREKFNHSKRPKSAVFGPLQWENLDLEDWERENQRLLRKYATVLHWIIDTVREHGGPCLVSNTNKETLTIWTAAGDQELVPPDAEVQLGLKLPQPPEERAPEPSDDDDGDDDDDDYELKAAHRWSQGVGVKSIQTP